MNITDTTRILNRIFNYFNANSTEFRAIAELPVSHNEGNTKIDFIVLLSDNSEEYFGFEFKYNRKNIQDNSDLTEREINMQSEMIQRVTQQYHVLTNLQISDWNSLYFPQIQCPINLIYVFINSIFISEYLQVLNFNFDKDSCFSVDKQGQDFIRNSNENIHFSRAKNLIEFVISNEELIIIPFTLIDLDFKRKETIPCSDLTRKQGNLLIEIMISFLRERISTLDKSYKIDDIYNDIFGEFEDRFAFGKEDKREILRTLRNFCGLLSELDYTKDLKVLTINKNSYKINIRNSKLLDKVLDRVKLKISQKIHETTLDSYMNT